MNKGLVICIQGECAMASGFEISIGIVLILLLKLILTRLITTLLSMILTIEEFRHKAREHRWV